jgi:uncharacterized protein (DUF488 family)
MRICTIGFTSKGAEEFFARLRKAGVKRLIDVRLNNTGQLSGFSKRDDLKFFTKEILRVDYVHLPLLAPTQEMLDEYRKQKRGWEMYEESFLKLMKEREIEKKIQRETLEDACLLCSEDKPHQCHRRLVAEYLQGRWDGVQIEHI